MNESPQWGGHGFNEVPQLDAAGASPQWFLTGCSLGGGWFRLTPHHGQTIAWLCPTVEGGTGLTADQ
jgi:hypothetical protein